MIIRRQDGNFQFEEDPFPNNIQLIGKIFPEVSLLKKLLQTKPSVKNLNIIYSDLYYTVIKNRAEKQIVDDEYETKEKNYNNFKYFITPNPL